MEKKPQEASSKEDNSSPRIKPGLKAGLERIPDPPELSAVAVYGSFSETLSVISRTNAHLHLVTGRLEDSDGESRGKVLVPFAEVRLGGGTISELQKRADEDDPPTLFSARLSLENLAFMVLDLMSDVRRLSTEVSSLANGELAVDPDRMAHVRYFVAHIERQARSCRIVLDRTFGRPEAKKD